VNRVGLYREAAVLAGVAAPAGLLRSSVLMDGRVWDGSDPDAYISSANSAQARLIFGHGAPQ
jgi:nitrate/nitrite transport system substrate-binding protein